MESLRELFVEELKDLYSAEKQIVKALPRLADASTCPELRAGFEHHLEQSKQHAHRLEQICRDLEVAPGGKFCKGAEGLLAEGAEMIKDDAPPEVMDAGLISAAQRVEHYEIAAYGTCVCYANQLGYTNAARLLEQTLMEEKATDKKLTALALAHINSDAMGAYAKTA